MRFDLVTASLALPLTPMCGFIGVMCRIISWPGAVTSGNFNVNWLLYSLVAIHYTVQRNLRMLFIFLIYSKQDAKDNMS